MALILGAETRVDNDFSDNPVLPLDVPTDICGDFGDGLLLDVDFADPLGAGGYTGAFAAGDKIPNSAWEHVARRLIPGVTSESLSVTISAAYAANALRIDRTSKGYPHIIVSQINDVVGTYLRFNLPAPLLAYILANPTHQYIATLTERLTRLDTWTGNAGNTEYVIQSTTASTSDMLFRMEGRNAGSGGMRPLANTGSKRALNTSLPDLGVTLGERYRAVGVTGLTATPAALTGSVMYGPAEAAGVNKSRSAILRRFTLEDLTVSQAALAAAVAGGSSATELQTLAGSDARHQASRAARLASADYYAGDTFTDPATFP